jgi:flagellar biosynthesis/type III secretory pathway M-ring protein FliF/YscJ
MGRGPFSLIIRLIAGAYIIYLGYQLISGYINPTEETGDPVWYALVFGIAFLAVGVFFIVDAIRKQAAPKEEEENEEEQTEETPELEASENASEDAGDGAEVQEKLEEKPEEKPEEELQPRTMSIAERIRRLSAEDEEEE